MLLWGKTNRESYYFDCLKTYLLNQGLPGTRLSPDGKTCKEIDLCEENNGGCSHDCQTSYGQVINLLINLLVLKSIVFYDFVCFSPFVHAQVENDWP